MRFMKYAVVVLFVLALVQPMFVSAHSELVRSTPANGAVLTAMPSQVVAVYSEELKTSGPSLTVMNATGQQVDSGDGKVDLDDINHKTMVVTLKSGLGDGTYTIHWKAITADDNGVTQGTITFMVKGDAAVSAPASNVAAGSSAPILPNTGSEGHVFEWLLGLALMLGLIGFGMRRRAVYQR